MSPTNPVQIRGLNPHPLSVRELDHFSYAEKLRHWLRADAWSPDGKRLQFKNPEYRIGDLRLEDGNIVSCKPLVGRPCFGIAIAYLRYRDHTRYVKGRGLLKAGRCHVCKARTACDWVVTQRLRSNPSLEESWSEWLKAGGPEAFSLQHFKRTHAYRCWGRLIRDLRSFPFTTVNDAHVAIAYEQKDREAKEKDRERKARERRKARRNGEIDEADLDLLTQAATRRAGVIYKARLFISKCPNQLGRTPWKSLYEMMDVWLGREVMRARKQKDNAPNIARWIVDTGCFSDCKNHAALASRVVKDLQRIGCFEKLSWEGEPLLPPLDHEREFPSKE